MKHVDDFTVGAAPNCFPSLIRFTYLQLLDVLTTLTFLMSGMQEANPLVRAAMGVTSNPLVALLYVKAFAVLLGIYCWRRNKVRLLERMNVFYAIVVAWNLLAIVVDAAAKWS